MIVFITSGTGLFVMTFSGLPSSTLLMLTAFSLLLIVVLYMIRQTKRRMEVPFSPLWTSILAKPEHSTFALTKLRTPLSLFLQVLMALLLISALAKPECPRNEDDPRHVLILLDRSASMAAVDEIDGKTRLQAARDKTRAILASQAPHDLVMVASFDSRVYPLSPFARVSNIPDESLEMIEPTPTRASLSGALQFARETLGDKPHTAIIVISDGADFVDRHDELLWLEHPVRHVGVGHDHENLAITSFAIRPYPTNPLDSELLIEIQSTFTQPVRANLEIYADERLSQVLPVSLEANGQFHAILPGQALVGESFEARIVLSAEDVKDVFPMDDTAYAVLPSREPLQVQLVTEGNLYLEAPLLVLPFVALHVVKPEHYDPARAYDVTIFDGHTLEMPNSGSVLYFAPQGDHSPWKVTGLLSNPIITDIDRNHALFRWMSFQDLNIAHASRMRLESSDVALASAIREPVIIAREHDKRRILGIGFRLQDSDFALRAGFPVFVLNALIFLGNNSLGEPIQFATGRRAKIFVDPAELSATLKSPGDLRIQLPIVEQHVYHVFEEPGLYSLETERGPQPIAVNLDAVESFQFAPQTTPWTETLDTIVTAPQTTPDEFKPWLWLTLVAFALLVLEWWTFNRRITV